MDPLTYGLIGGALGLVKGIGSSNSTAAQNQAEIAKTRYGWQRGVQGDIKPVQSPLGDVLGGGLSGYLLGQNVAAANKLGNDGDLWDRLLKAQTRSGMQDASGGIPSVIG